MKKWLRRSCWIIVVLLVLVNVMAFFHARKFTHFNPDMDRRTDPSKVSFGKKMGYLLTGVDLPRPVNDFAALILLVCDSAKRNLTGLRINGSFYFAESKITLWLSPR